jgi:hypothetical protein
LFFIHSSWQQLVSCGPQKAMDSAKLISTLEHSLKRSQLENLFDQWERNDIHYKCMFLLDCVFKIYA